MGSEVNSTTNSPKIYRAPVSAQCTQGSAVETPVQSSRFGASWSFYVVADFFLFWGDHCKIFTPKQKNPSTSSYIQTSMNPTKLQKTTFTLVHYLKTHQKFGTFALPSSQKLKAPPLVAASSPPPPPRRPTPVVKPPSAWAEESKNKKTWAFHNGKRGRQKDGCIFFTISTYLYKEILDVSEKI